VLAGGEPFEFYTFQISSSTTDESLRENLWKGLTTIRREKSRPPPTAEAVSEAFRPGGPAFNEARSQLVAEAHYLVHARPVDFASKFEPWFEVFGYVYNNFEARCDSWSPFATDLSDIARSLKGSGHFGKLRVCPETSPRPECVKSPVLPRTSSPSRSMVHRRIQRSLPPAH